MAHALAGSTHIMDWMEVWVADLPGVLDRGERHCREAVRLDPDDSLARATLGEVLLCRREYEASGAQLEEAVALNPNDSFARAIYGWYLQSTGRTEAAVEQFEEGRVRDPFERSWYSILHGIAIFADRRYREAVEMLLQTRDPWNEVRGWLAASYGYLEEAEKAAERLAAFLDYAETDMAVFPGRRYSDWLPYWTRVGGFRDPADLEHLLEGLRRAGLQD